jgi:hypothetical protein
MANFINLVFVPTAEKAGTVSVPNAVARWRRIYTQPFNYAMTLDALPTEGAGESAGVGDALGVSSAIAASVGDSAGVGTALGQMSVIGTSDGVGAASAVGSYTYTGDSGYGSSDGLSTVSGIGGAIAASVGFADGAGDAPAVGTSEVAGSSIIAGTSEASAVSGVLLSTIVTYDFTYTPLDITLADFNARRENPGPVSIAMPVAAPATLSYSEGITAPDIGQHVIADFGNGPLFQGPIQQLTTRYEEITSQLVWDVNAVDYTWFLNRKRPFQRWDNTSASAVVTELVTQFASSDFSVVVEAGLPNITIECNGERDLTDCLTDIMHMVPGSSWRLDGKVVRFFITDTDAPPDDVVDASPTLLPGIQETKDATQLRTRIFVKGMGTPLRADAKAGDDELDLQSNEIFNSGGGWVVIGSQRIRYTGKATRDVLLEDNSTGGVTGTVADSYPNARMFPSNGASRGYGGGLYMKPMAFSTRFVYSDGTLSDFSMISNWNRIYEVSYYVDLINIPKGGVNANGKPTIARRVYAILDFDTTKMVPWTQINDNTTTHVHSMRQTMTLSTEDRPMKSPAPPGPTWPNGIPTVSRAGQSLQEFENSPIPSSYTPGGGALYFSWIYPDGTESALSANYIIVPDDASDGEHMWEISGLPTMNSAGLPVWRGMKPMWLKPWFIFGSGGEWIPCWPINLDDERVSLDRTSGLSSWAGTPGPRQPRIATPPTEPVSELHFFLTGIPTTGPGSIVRDIQAHFEGIDTDTNVRIFVQVDDIDAQHELAVKEGGDGVHEDTIGGDYASTTVAATAGQVMLQLYARPIYTVVYPCRDPKAKAGKDVFIHTVHPPCGPYTLKIMNVSVDQIHEDGTGILVERYHITASSVRNTFDELMHRMLQATQ